ncbi:hypothetical protein [Sedimenticola thiotaurini]|uniref:Uncharacterized protein n=1 Tax=Sedimenticola thiotaurini TaxID=1543721 RepID=A0A0F7K1X9_9GAMM|nr:hypothetical protein [Sedimenticola thiotaurini]AKH21917.1 hypothetical protein AAY24_17960 [Sedimenticola thiotaurini]
MTKEGQRRFIFTMIIWWIGLIAANSVCDIFASVEWVSRIVPAIKSFKLAAAPENACSADGIWTYAWLVAPIFFIWITYIAYIEPTYERTAKQRGWGVPFVFLLLLIGCLTTFYGIYDPYPGTGKGRWETMYRESEVGVIAVTTAAWVGTYGLLLMSALLITEIFRIKRNQ